jgi:transcription termination factor Rho
MNVVEAMELLKTRVTKTKSNAEFLLTMSKG